MGFRTAVLASFVLGFLIHAAAAAETVGVTEVTSNVLVFATSTGNVTASVGPDGAFLIGTPSATSTEQISTILAERTKNPMRYVVISPEKLADSEGDAGWGKRGAFVVMQEKALERLGGHKMGPPRPLPAKLIQLGVNRPPVAFSEVITFDLNGDGIHVVHQSPGYSNGDAIAHFHAANLLYFGEVFPGDGYPSLDSELGANIDGIIKTLTPWTDSNRRIVPTRGKVMNGSDVKAFLDMLTAVRDQVQHMADAGRSESETVAGHPTKEFDARWGQGRVTPDAFVSALYTELKTRHGQ
ncbi:MAG TPA: hypothetical protein VHZ07_08045 [Bryobacteraceae bacterium]|jgi:hypothetical protein|nr:hypothetical protein [Bryobacteraceae bacterium]